MDRRILLGCMILAQRKKVIGILSYIFVKTSSIIYFILYVATGAALISAGDNRISLYVAAPFICLLTGYCLRAIFKRLRPYKKYKYKLKYNLKKLESYSFPSNHSASSMVISLALSFVGIPIWPLAFIFAFMTGLSRVFMGLHYFSDVAAGWTLGILFGITGFYILA